MIPRRFGLLPLCAALSLAALTADPWNLAEAGPSARSAEQGVPGHFTFASVVRRAGDLAAAPYQPDQPALPAFFAGLDYDQYRDIRFRRDQSIWRSESLPFQVELFPRGGMFKDRVTINLIEGGKAVPVPFKSSLYNYGKNDVPADLANTPEDLGFAGVRLLYPLNRDDVFDELAVFLGASYFRAVPQGLNYGLSARGLAIDTGLASKEEFPNFREFWLEKPDRDATSITIYALLDSPSVAGAYRFLITPGLETVIDVKAQLFFRERVKKLGLAPLTSMFFHAEDTDRFMDDFRPEVHDSDGLLIETGTGERIWRPLVNPKGLRISDFRADSARAFGLLQRDRDFNNYQDLEAHYQKRPSALVEPIGDWGKGVVEVVEIPSDSERYDNIAAFWVPERAPAIGKPFEYNYRLRIAADPEAKLTGGRTLSTRIGAGGTVVLDSNKRKFVVDFGGPTLASLPPETPVEAVVTSSSGTLSKSIVQPNPETNGWRLFFELTPDGGVPVDLRAYLRNGNDVLSETWSFKWIRE
ncbi:glucan biosynthesis protein [uncultured Thiodictyon sp.]|uniref:glucan biosynthesis protein n=1 Tax=uncultured Thiodictyon sp. TaxID=1846217 RepID=UPI0025D0207F|nr:glucan biosynthesis protein [uncultured Thiodictyon sp.]